MPVSLSPHALDYPLPEARIAERPLADRDASRLLLVRAGGEPEDRTFRDLATLIPEGALLVVNDTSVIRARVELVRRTGGRVELLLLEPVAPERDPARVLALGPPSTWACLLSGRRHRPGDVLTLPGPVPLRATVQERNGAEATVELAWQAELGSLADVLHRVGRTPLPPYIRRPDDDADVVRYQTVYARTAGSVAAPTAGLHFTPAVLQGLAARGIRVEHLTLHVGAGTFRPIQADDVAQHAMHGERVHADARVLAAVAEQLQARRPVVAVGTTSLRALESLRWAGAELLAGRPLPPRVEQWAWEGAGARAPVADAFARLAATAGTAPLTMETRLMVAPGYPFGVVDALVTNFHQPRSTLILLVAAFLGGDRWRRVYEHALARDYRFLSYGDSSLLWRPQ